MSDYYGQTIEGQPCTDWKGIHAECAKHPQFVIRVEKYDEDREISLQQMKYLHAVVFPTLAREMHCSLWEAEFTCKRWCGEPWELIKKVGPQMYVECSKTKLTTKQCNAWIESIWDWAQSRKIHIPAPDKDWRKSKDARPESNLPNP